MPISRQGNSLDSSELNTFTVVQADLVATLRRANQQSPAMLELHNQFLQGSLGVDYFVKDGLMFYRGKLWIPDFENIREQLLQEFHNTPQAGHGGVLKTYKALGNLFFWPCMKQDVHRFVERCHSCQSTKYIPAKPQGLLQ